jgi:hypothetical protein
MKKRVCLVLLFTGLGSGCVPTSFVAVVPGTIAVGDLNVTASTTWNAAPAVILPTTRKEAQVWTQDGLLLNRLTINPAIPDGEPIFASRDKSVALPVFKADMLPNEIEELVESSLVKFFGEGNAVVNTSGLRPHRFGDNQGILFDYEASLTDRPDYRGLVGAFVANGHLYLITYTAAEPYYYGKYIDEAKMIIESATLQPERSVDET